MENDLSERRLTENELIFRELNQKVLRDLTELKDLAHEHDQATLAPKISHPLHFYCECSNMDCRKRVVLSVDEYERIHENSRHFVIIKGHQLPDIEHVISSTPEYDIIEKNREPSQIVGE